jgi:hypothetical protein
MKVVLIAQKRLHDETEKAFVFLTYHHSGKFISIPKSQIIKPVEFDLIKNEHNSEECFKFTLSDWIFSKLKDSLSWFNADDIRIL